MTDDEKWDAFVLKYEDWSYTDLLDEIWDKNEEIEALKEDISDLHEQIRDANRENDLYF